jgi:phosphoserine phosphatase RsbU/P
MSSTSQSEPDRQTLHCMEIWGGIEPVERTVTTPGLDAWVFSQPFHGDEQGGDVYYVTLCGGGLITRIVLADVSGHGASVAEFSLGLRALVRKNINQKSQGRLVGQLNRQFTEMAELRRFATALVATDLASTNRISVCNAGHPRPLFRREIDGDWSMLAPTAEDATTENLPFGLDEESRYQVYEVELGRGDLLVFYTDALIEAADSEGRLLGESGLLNTVRQVDLSDRSPAVIGRALLEAVAGYRKHRSADDDMTLIVVHHNAEDSPRLSLAQKLDVYAKVFGLKPV